MHPPLARHKHKSCIEVPFGLSVPSSAQAIDALHKCHTERNIAKFWGVCNEFKDALDACLKEEVRPEGQPLTAVQKKPIRKKALEESKAARAKWEQAKAARQSGQ